MSSKLFATQTQNFIECSKRHRFRNTNEYIQISYKKLNTAADVGTMYHSALENLLSIENLKKDTISDYISKYCSDDSNGIHSDFANSIEGRDAVYYLYNLIAKVKSIENFSDFDIATEYEYKNNENFYGKIDLLLRKKNYSILIDYKTGKNIFDSSGNLKNDIETQLLIYQIMEYDEVNHSEINTFIYNKSADVIEMKFDKAQLKIFKKKISDLIDKYSKDEYTTGNEEDCLSCNFVSICDTYKEISNTSINDLNSIHGEIVEIKKEGPNCILLLNSKDTVLKNIISKVSIKNYKNLIDIEKLKLNQEVKIKNIRFLSQNENQARFLLSNYGSLVIIT